MSFWSSFKGSETITKEENVTPNKLYRYNSDQLFMQRKVYDSVKSTIFNKLSLDPKSAMITFGDKQMTKVPMS